MLNKIKFIFLLLFCIVISTGCTLKYSLHINYDGTFSDSIVIQESKENFEKLGYDMNSYVEEQYDLYKKYHFYNDYYKSYLLRDDYARVSGTHSKWNLENFNYSSMFIKSGFESISVTNEDNIMILEAKGNKLNSLFSNVGTDGGPDFSYESVDLVITSDYNVIESNADEVNKLKNEFIWHFDKDNLDKDIYLKMNSKQTIGGKLVANVRNNFIGIVILLSVSIVIVVIGVFFYKQYQKVNEF